MVLSVLDGFRTQRAVQIVVTRVFVGPLPHGVEHVLLDLDVFIADGWVVKGAEDVVDDFIHWHGCVLPGVQHAAVPGLSARWYRRLRYGIYLRDSVLQDGGRNSAGARVQDVGEVVFGQHRVSRVGAGRVPPGLQLIVGACADDP